MRLIFIFAVLACVLSSCGSRPLVPDGATFSYHRDPQINSIKRIVIMPFHRANDVGTSAEALDISMSSAWRELGQFEVIGATEEERDQLITEDAFRKRNIDSESLRRVFADFKADAVLIGRIETFNSYDPVVIATEAALVSCLNGAVLWTGGGHFDGARESIQDDIIDWHRDAVGAGNQSVAGWRATLQSPRMFARYVSDRLAVTALEEMLQSPEPLQPTHSRQR